MSTNGHCQVQSPGNDARLGKTMNSVAHGEGRPGSWRWGSRWDCRERAGQNITAQSSPASVVTEAPQSRDLGQCGRSPRLEEDVVDFSALGSVMDGHLWGGFRQTRHSPPSFLRGEAQIFGINFHLHPNPSSSDRLGHLSACKL